MVGWLIVFVCLFAFQHNNVAIHKDEIAAPECWEWKWPDWTVDLNRAVDEDGKNW